MNKIIRESEIGNDEKNECNLFNWNATENYYYAFMVQVSTFPSTHSNLGHFHTSDFDTQYNDKIISW